MFSEVLKYWWKPWYNHSVLGILLYQERVLQWYKTVRDRTAQRRNNTFSPNADHNTNFCKWPSHIHMRMRAIYLAEKTIFTDKIYNDIFFFNENNTVKVLTLVNQKCSNKGEKQLRTCSHKPFLLKQPIESFFNWINVLVPTLDIGSHKS
mgnify:CR=1 FL=1